MSDRLPAPPRVESLREIIRYLDTLVRELESFATDADTRFSPSQQFSITASTNAEGFNATYIVNASGGNVSIALPLASTVPQATFTLKKTDSSGNTAGFTSTTANIDGASSQTVNTQYRALTVYSDGTSWHVVGRVV